MLIVGIVHINNKDWALHKFNDADVMLNWWEENKHLPGNFYTINMKNPTKIIKPRLAEIHAEHMQWCPWCAAARYFLYSHRKSRCMICHVDAQEYWVRRTNGEAK